MKTGHGSAPRPFAGAKWKTCCWVTVSGGSSTRPPSSGAIHAPAATTATGAVNVSPSVAATAPAAGGCRQRDDRGVEAHVGAVGGRQPEHRGDRAVGVEHAGVFVVHDPADAVEVDERPPLGRRLLGEQLGGHAALGQHRMQPLRLARVAEVDAAGQREQALARRGLERAPAPPGLPGQPHVERIRVGAAEDPGAAVRAAVAVRGTERLEHDDVQAAAGGRVGGGRAGQPRADDHQVRTDRHDEPPEGRLTPFPGLNGINRQSQDHYSERTLGDSAGLTARLLDADRTRETSRARGAGGVRRLGDGPGPGALARDRGSFLRCREALARDCGSLWALRRVPLDHDRGSLGAAARTRWLRGRHDHERNVGGGSTRGVSGVVARGDRGGWVAAGWDALGLVRGVGRRGVRG